MNSSDALDDSFEQLGNHVLDLVDLAHLEHFLELCEEQGLLDTVSKRPKL